ncbi:MAG: hypothetical protein AAFR58_18465 [Cyanobacteria bacterium J06627_28]
MSAARDGRRDRAVRHPAWQAEQVGLPVSGEKASGAQLGDEFTFKGLQQQLGINYQPQRDDAVVKAQYTKSGREPAAVEQEAISPVVQPSKPDLPEPQRRQRGWELEL